MSPEIDEELIAAGFRPTRQRRAVYTCLMSLNNHPSAEEVFAAVRLVFPGISLATVYKALDSLASAGLILKLGGQEASARFDGRVDRHHHARCRACGMVHDLEPEPELSRLLEHAYHPAFHIEGFRLEFFGLCSRCRGSGRGQLIS